MKFVRIVAYMLGCALISSAFVMYGTALAARRADHLNPLRAKLSLNPGTTAFFEVPVKATGKYEIVIDAEAARLTADPVHPSITWRLFEGSDVVSQGDTTDQPSTNWWGTLEQMVGRFRGESGHSYTLALSAKANTERIAAAEPEIVVQIPRDNWEGQLAGNAILVIAAIVTGVLGIALIAVPYFGAKWLAHRKMAKRLD